MNSDQYCRAAPLHDAPLPSLRPMLYVLTALVAAFVITVFAEPTLSIRNSAVLVPTGFICMGIFLWRAKSVSPGVLRLVFVLLAAHAVVGYLVAESTVPWVVSGTLDDRMLAVSFALIASGLMVAAYSFHLSAPSKGWLPRVDNRKLVRLAICMTTAAVVGILYFYNRNKLLPWQFDVHAAALQRYQISGLDEWLINRSTDILMITIPLLFLFDGAARVLSLAGFLALALTFKRAPILDVIAVVAISHVIRTGKLRKLILTVCALVGLYAASQLLYQILLYGEVSPEDAYSSIASGLPEVRDLGWILWLNGHDMQWGATLVQPVSPIPTVVSPWIQEHSLRTLTTKMTGHDKEETGGLRLTLAGEGYLNFGILGTMALCALWGWGMRKISSVVKAASESGAAVHAYFAALLVSWMGFWLHLGGSQSSGVIRSSVLLLAVMYYICRPRVSANSPQIS